MIIFYPLPSILYPMGKTQGIRPGELKQKGRHEIGRTPWSQHFLDEKNAKFFELLKRLGRGSPENRRKAADEVIKLAHLADSPRAKEILAERLGSERMAFVRAHLLRVITAMAKIQIDCKEFLPQIKLILREGSDFEKMESANALRHIGDRASVPPLVEARDSGQNLLPPAKRAIEKAIDSLSEGEEEAHSDSCGTGIDIST
jgi:hypothetical protein